MFYPLFINLKKKRVLIVGGGNVGFRRALYLLNSGAIVTVISRKFNKGLLKIKNNSLALIKKEIKSANNPKINFKRFFLIIIATDDKKINKAIHAQVRKASKNLASTILVCRADRYLAGDVLFPAVSKAGKGIIAFTTLGKNPRLVKRIKDLLR